ncbi:MAG: hypothetical protein FJ303_21035 [Planctomycetes bacterium]|nr:hypothetical protein [Planctomycetota bacterium]
MIQLTKDQHDALANNGQGPAKVVDPITNTEYVLLRAEEFARLKGTDPAFEKATEDVFQRHEEVLRRLA